MKKGFLYILPVLAFGLAHAQTKAPVKKAPVKTATAPVEKLKLTSKTDSLSYAIGFAMASNLKQQKIKVNITPFNRATKDVLMDQAIALDEVQIQEILAKFQQDLQAKAEAEKNKEGDANKLAGQKFLEANKTAEGVVTTASGLQYQIIQEGAGLRPGPTDQVKVHYTGTLINGTVFDSSVERGEPITFGVNQVIKGWTEVLQLMPVGSKWKVFIPSDLAYGASAPPSIGPNQTLIFDVELLGIEGK